MKKIVFATLILITQQALAEETMGNSYFDGFFFGAGGGGSHFQTEAEFGGTSVSESHARPFGTLVFGNGKTSNSTQIYWGGELSVDISRTSSGDNAMNRKIPIGDVRLQRNVTENIYVTTDGVGANTPGDFLEEKTLRNRSLECSEVKIRANGINPAFAFKIGFAPPNSRILFFARVGIAYSKVACTPKVQTTSGLSALVATPDHYDFPQGVGPAFNAANPATAYYAGETGHAGASHFAYPAGTPTADAYFNDQKAAADEELLGRASQKLTTSKLVPILGGGVEIASSKGSLRFDIEYRMGTKRDGEFVHMETKPCVSVRATAIHYLKF